MNLVKRCRSFVVLSALFMTSSVVMPLNSAEAQNSEQNVVERVVSQKTQKAGNLKEISRISETGSVSIGEGLSVELLSPETKRKSSYEFNRDDGAQIVNVYPPGSDELTQFKFEGMSLLKLSDGAVLVNSAESGETLFYIDPAWASDTRGNRVPTYFIADGDTLTQVVNGSDSSTSIVADPYIRDVKNGTRKVGQELVFSKEETGRIAAGGTVVCAGLAGWYAVGCAVAPAVASYALSQDNCLAIRALGSSQAPNLIFPVSTRC